MEVNLTELGDDLYLRKCKKKREIENSSQGLKTENAGKGSRGTALGLGIGFVVGVINQEMSSWMLEE